MAKVNGESNEIAEAGVTGLNTSGGGGVTGGPAILGVSAAGIGVKGSSVLAVGVHGESVSGRGVVAISDTDYGLRAASRTSAGIRGSSVMGRGVEGWATNSEGVVGISTNGNGVWGQTDGAGIGVLGTSKSGIGVEGQSTTSFGVRGTSTSGRGVVAISDTDYGLRAASRTSAGARASSVEGRGAEGWSTNSEGLVGISTNGNGVWGQTDGAGVGVLGTSRDGVGIHGRGGRLAGLFEGDVSVTGDISMPNADCAEDFDVADATAEPGSVMVLGDEGTLYQGSEPYDRRVAGVVSGAGSYRPAIVLDKQAEGADRKPIALFGKVYCKVDADYAEIKVGDLLTTSATAGHAMKAADPVRAFGAVIGKALRPQKHGIGLIPILIALQ